MHEQEHDSEQEEQVSHRSRFGSGFGWDNFRAQVFTDIPKLKAKKDKRGETDLTGPPV
jgi:hypothetical protein